MFKERSGDIDKVPFIQRKQTINDSLLFSSFAQIVVAGAAPQELAESLQFDITQTVAINRIHFSCIRRPVAGGTYLVPCEMEFTCEGISSPLGQGSFSNFSPFRLQYLAFPPERPVAEFRGLIVPSGSNLQIENYVNSGATNFAVGDQLDWQLIIEFEQISKFY